MYYGVTEIPSERRIKQINKKINPLSTKIWPHFYMELVKLVKQAKAKRKGGFEVRHNCHDVHAVELKLKNQSKDTQRSIRNSKE